MSKINKSIAIIRKVGSKWVLFSKKGKRLGTFDSKKAAEKREREINFFKHKGKGQDKESTEVQTIIFSKSKFSKQEARNWLKEHDFESSSIDETSESFRARQESPGSFKTKSFRIITLDEPQNIRAVVGRPK